MEIPLNLYEIILAILIVVFGSTLQGSIGFGLGPFSVPLLLLIDPIFVPGPVLLGALVLTILMYNRERHAVHKNEIKWAVIGRFFGTILGAAILTIISKNKLSLLFGTVILFSLFIFVSGIRLKMSIFNLIFVGTISGFMGTTTSIGGPPMALLYQDKKGPQIRGTLSGIFIVGTIIAILSLIFINKFGLIELKVAALLIPGIFVGYYFSYYSSKILDKGYIRTTILIVSALTSTILIIKYFYNI